MGNDILQGHQNQRASILATQFLIDLLNGYAICMFAA